MKKILTVNLYLLVLVCVFDPANALLHLKTPFFLSFMSLWLIEKLVDGRPLRIEKGTVLWVFGFLVMAFIGLAGGFMHSLLAGTPFGGFSRISAFVFCFIALGINDAGFDFRRILDNILVLMAGATILIYLAREINPSIGAALYAFAEPRGMFTYAPRNYGAISFQSVYFHTSSMLVLSLVAHFDAILVGKFRRGGVLREALLTALILAALLISGSRNNLLFSIIALLSTMAWRSRNKPLFALVMVAFAGFAVFSFSGTFSRMLDPVEYSNSVKISYLNNYSKEFDDIFQLFFGMGLSSSFYSDVWAEYVFVTELTYLEVLRNFGLFGSVAVIGLMVFPGIHRKKEFGRAGRADWIGYWVYLGICALNPLYFSSSGIMLAVSMLAPEKEQT